MRRILILWNTVVLLVLFAALGVTARTFVRAGMYASVDRELSLRAEAFQAKPPRPARSERRPPDQRRGNPFKIHLFDLSGFSLSPPGRYPLWDDAAFRQCQDGSPRTTTILRDGEPLRILSRPVFEDGRLTGVIQAPYPVYEVEQVGVFLDRTFLMMLPVVALAAWGGAVLLTGRVLLPIRRLTEATERIGARNLSERLPLTGDDEFTALTATFNRMLGRLETGFLQQKQFTEDASHELKTPLTRIKATASMALAAPPTPERLTDALQRIDSAADAMSTLVQDLLLLAQGDGGHLGRDRTTFPARLLLEQARDCASRPDGSSIHLVIEPADMTYTGNEGELQRVLGNLLDNALRHTPPDGAITITARPGRLEVSDTGCGIPEERLARLGERFYRVDDARTRKGGGTGLGLAICKSILAAHGGTLLTSSTLGTGTTVVLEIP
jgi:signal transduction histidine kinase